MLQFQYRLALELGMTVGRLKQEMTMRELAEWIAYYQTNPFGPERADAACGVIASTVANVSNSKNKCKPSDFMINYGKEKPQTMEEQQNVLKKITAAMQAVHKAKNNG